MTSMKKRAVLYARVSGDDRGKEGRNLEGQLEMCREYALERGLRIVAELSEDDRGASGASFELPTLGEVLDKAEAGDFDVLLVREIDRLSRNLAKQLIVEEELRRHGVEVQYVLADYPDTPEGRLNKHIRATIAEYEREKIIERMLRGRHRSVQAGNVLVYGRPAYGYDSAKVDGKWVLLVNEEEARIVRQIFAWYTGEERMSLRQITQRLTGMRVPTRADVAKMPHRKKRAYGVWSISTISGIIDNEIYTGVWRYKDDITLPVPAIIDRVTWESAQARKLENKCNARRRCKREYLMRRRLQCSVCHRSMKARAMNGGKHLYYVCFHKDCPQNKNFRAGFVDEKVWAWVKSLLTSPAALTRGLREYQELQDIESEPIRERVNVIDDLLNENRAQLDRLLDLYVDGEFPKEVLIDRKSRLEGTIQALEVERTELVVRLEKHTLSSDQVQSLGEFLAGVAARLEVMDDFDTRRRIIEDLDVRAVLGVEDGEETVRPWCFLNNKNEKNEGLSFESVSTSRDGKGRGRPEARLAAGSAAGSRASSLWPRAPSCVRGQQPPGLRPRLGSEPGESSWKSRRGT
jgi:site-specific DNA recombinase